MVKNNVKSMKEKVNFSQFLDSFSETYKDNFSFEGKRALFDYLEQFHVDGLYKPRNDAL